MSIMGRPQFWGHHRWKERNLQDKLNGWAMIISWAQFFGRVPTEKEDLILEYIQELETRLVYWDTPKKWLLLPRYTIWALRKMMYGYGLGNCFFASSLLIYMTVLWCSIWLPPLCRNEGFSFHADKVWEVQSCLTQLVSPLGIFQQQDRSTRTKQ